jgi:DNA-binding NtrC family response regulator
MLGKRGDTGKMTIVMTEIPELLHITPPFSGAGMTTEKTSRISVLYVDETLILLDTVCRFLEKSGEMMADASLSFEDAVDKMRYISYDVIVTDYNFENGDGNALLRYTREKGDMIPFIYFVLFRKPYLEYEATKFGGVTFIEKRATFSDSLFSDLCLAIKKATRAYIKELKGITGNTTLSARREK